MMRKRWAKKVTSMLLALAMIVAGIGPWSWATETVKADDTSVFTDDFSDTSSGWLPSKWTKTAGDDNWINADDGLDYALRVTNNSTYTHTVSGMNAGKYYLQYSANYNGNWTDDFKVKIAVSGNEQIKVEEKIQFTAWNNFKAKDNSVVKTTGVLEISETSDIVITLTLPVVSGKYLFIDDIILYKKAVAGGAPTHTTDELSALIAKVPADLSGFTTTTKNAVETAKTAAQTCVTNSATSDIDSCYSALATALDGLRYDGGEISVAKVNGLSSDFIKGIDISSYIVEKNSGVKYYDWNGNEVDANGFLKLFADVGINYVRLRVWNNPKTDAGEYYGGGNNDLDMTLNLCRMIKTFNEANPTQTMKVLIDLQYSDFWADPDKQTAPKAWKDYSIEQKITAVQKFTKDTLAEVADTGVEIGMVQIGNETNTGICGTEAGTDDYYKIFKAGCDAVEEYNTANNTTIKRVVHFTDPQKDQRKTAKGLKENGVNYDVYATSYYPFWHGTPEHLNWLLSEIAKENDVEVMVAETQYVFTNDDYDGADNQAYEGKDNIDLSGWPVSVQGQANEIRDVINAVAGVGEAGIGMFYWEPAWLGVGNAHNANGSINQSALASNKTKWETYGSGWATNAAREYDKSAKEWGGGGTNCENAALFNFTGHPLASLNVFKYVNYGAETTAASFYGYKALGMVSVTMKSNAATIKAALPKTAEYSLNDGTTGNATIAWDDSSIASTVAKIAGTSAIGNTYQIQGTITVKGKPQKVLGTISVDPSENLLVNGDFETGAGQDAWTISNDKIFFLDDSENQRNGSNWTVAIKGGANFVKDLTPDANGCYSSSITQSVKITNPGAYEVRGFFEGGPGIGAQTGEAINISVKYGDSTKVSNNVELSGWMTWKAAVVSDIRITQEMIDDEKNTIEVSANITIQKDAWGSLDDVYLYRLDDTPTASTPSSSTSSSSTASTPNVETKPDGTRVETTTRPNANGGETETVTETATDGSKKETVTETAADGTVVKTTVTDTATDGSKVEKVSESTTNKAGKDVAQTTTTKTDKDGKVTGVTEKSVIENSSATTSTTVTVKKDGEGEITSAKASVEKTVASGNKATVTAAVVAQITEAAGTENVVVTMTVKDSEGKTKYKVQVETENLEAGNELYIYKKDTKTGEYVMVNAKTYEVKDNGNVSVSMSKKATYELVDSDKAAQIDKAIKGTIVPEKKSATVKAGKKSEFKLSKKANKENIKNITYTTDNKSVATVDKNGKITAKGSGTVTVKAKVTLKNGATKTIKMKVKVK